MKDETMLVNEDPIFSVRKAVIDGMCRCGMQPDKRLIDAVVDSLPDFFRQPLTAEEPTAENLVINADAQYVCTWIIQGANIGSYNFPQNILELARRVVG